MVKLSDFSFSHLKLHYYKTAILFFLSLESSIALDQIFGIPYHCCFSRYLEFKGAFIFNKYLAQSQLQTKRANNNLIGYLILYNFRSCHFSVVVVYKHVYEQQTNNILMKNLLYHLLLLVKSNQFAGVSDSLTFYELIERFFLHRYPCYDLPGKYITYKIYKYSLRQQLQIICSMHPIDERTSHIFQLLNILNVNLNLALLSEAVIYFKFVCCHHITTSSSQPLSIFRMFNAALSAFCSL